MEEILHSIGVVPVREDVKDQELAANHSETVESIDLWWSNSLGHLGNVGRNGCA